MSPNQIGISKLKVSVLNANGVVVGTVATIGLITEFDGINKLLPSVAEIKISQ